MCVCENEREESHHLSTEAAKMKDGLLLMTFHRRSQQRRLRTHTQNPHNHPHTHTHTHTHTQRRQPHTHTRNWNRSDCHCLVQTAVFTLLLGDVWTAMMQVKPD